MDSYPRCELNILYSEWTVDLRISADTRLARYLWDSGLPILAKDVGDLNDLPARYIIPQDYADVLCWARVIRNPNKKDAIRSYLLVHRSPGPNGADAHTEVTVHIQGFVKKCDLTQYGSWKQS